MKNLTKKTEEQLNVLSDKDTVFESLLDEKVRSLCWDFEKNQENSNFLIYFL